jgi:uncharacterized protein YbcI
VTSDTPAPVGGQLLTELSNAMVALHRKHFGRGAGAAKSFLFDEMVLCLLTDIYTPVEKTLMRAGNVDHVRQTRLMHQIALEEEYKRPVEELTGRKVRAFISSVHFDPDVAVELFILEPEFGEDQAVE